ncbi:ErpK protein (plasmid) [Borreliella bissettiae DN127]|uniref:ErpK protein n=1 Tax=Borrelia bissettiae (strain DSM 17990 / CIP 109136 / DN127) TaxID=521010 RepID=G0ANP6_BORBD|nr:hypothetical protein [Borreliella bissettiae]AEL19322.1 ErpK protein [Borreliella bissettiae DN127]
MNKKMFTICLVFALIVSCKNYASGEDVKKSLEQSEQFEQELKKQVTGFLDIKKKRRRLGDWRTLNQKFLQKLTN